eukprot:CAMPEP_0184334974 /NCGR_PEP_ID=MMETSP1089-20130417/3619_1 /TAXON_ID=38269 ORGANISM="Gloeochaete wittrockiana, Strain SAG46.84" /NCGR_SAMPLE_ID=MMETSP1089 /ASSEMBLY_ACC=CAM_ASM_000445 /LENGTH=692 /DNA_ID=CAMNT_0026659417 /DNA_START=86 /DNA_END=2161 /DNA_ORIENTATION=+
MASVFECLCWSRRTLSGMNVNKWNFTQLYKRLRCLQLRSLKILLLVVGIAAVLALFLEYTSKYGVPKRFIATAISYSSVNVFSTHSDSDEVAAFFWVWNSVDMPLCRMFDSVRSVARYHPDADLQIYSFVEIKWASEIPGLKVVPLDAVAVLSGTPLQDWYEKRDEWKIAALGFWQDHLSEALRLALLFKNGGVFLEADMLLCRSLSPSLRNVLISRGRPDEVGTSFMYFDRESPIIFETMVLFAEEYDAQLLTRNAPRILRKACVSVSERGGECTIMPSVIMYPFGSEDVLQVGGYGGWNELDVKIALKKVERDSFGVALSTYRGREHHINKLLDMPTHFKNDSVLGLLVANHTSLTTFKCVDSSSTSLLQKRTLFAMMSIYSNNIGDEVQAVAALQHYPQVDMFLSRDSLHEGLPSTPYHIHEQLQERTRRPRVVVLMNAWFSNKWHAPNEDIYPIFQSWHWDVSKTSQIEPSLLKSNVAYLKKHEPIGARSTATMKFLKSLNISSYFSACLTLSLRNRFLSSEKDRTDTVYIIDTPRTPHGAKLLRKFVPQWVIESATYQSHDIDARHYPNSHLKTYLAMDYLRTYARAKLIITERLHAALPSIALGTPVLFLVPTKSVKDIRNSGLLDLMRVVKGDDDPDVLKDFDFRKPPPNPSQPLIDQYVANLTRAVRAEFFKAAGTVPVQGSSW